MIWSKQELEHLILGGAELTRERVLKHLSAPENADIFAVENFSYLWGVLGVSGVKGLEAETCRKIWQVLHDNGVVDAFDKGILDDYNRALIAKYRDNRMYAWQGLNNFQAGVKFQKSILEKLVRCDEQLAAEIAPLLFDYRKMREWLDKHKIDTMLKNYLERVRELSASYGISGDTARAVYEKNMILRALCDVVAYTSRELGEDEKDYLFRYLREAVLDGFDPHDIGLDDMVLAKLMAGDVGAGVPELEREPLHSRNVEIEEFATGFEEKEGFFEEVAAKYVRIAPNKAEELTTRCLKLIEKGKRPCGVVFALALLELKQVKSVVRILLALAQKGRAIEMTVFLHRLLPLAKGEEAQIGDILMVNLQHFPETTGFVLDYARRRTLFAVRDFIEAGCPKPGAVLLKYMVAEHQEWLEINALQDYIAFGNALIAIDKTLASEIVEQAQKMGLSIYEADNALFIGTAEDNLQTVARRQLEKNVFGATTFDISMAIGKTSGLEGIVEGSVDEMPTVGMNVEMSSGGVSGIDEIVFSDVADLGLGVENDTGAVGSDEVFATTEAEDTVIVREQESDLTGELPAVGMNVKTSSGDVSGADEVVFGDVADVGLGIENDTGAVESDEVFATTEAEDTVIVRESAGDPTVKLPAFEEWGCSATEMVPVGQMPTMALAEKREFISPAYEITATGMMSGATESDTGDILASSSGGASETDEAVFCDVADPGLRVEDDTGAVGSGEVFAMAEAECSVIVQEMTAVEPVQVAQIHAEIEQIQAEAEQMPQVQSELEQVSVSEADDDMDKLPAFEEWDNESSDSGVKNHQNKINMNNILNINFKDIDKLFEKSKQLMATVMQQARDKMEHSGLTHLPTVEKAKSLLRRFLKKK